MAEAPPQLDITDAPDGWVVIGNDEEPEELLSTLTIYGEGNTMYSVYVGLDRGERQKKIVISIADAKDILKDEHWNQIKERKPSLFTAESKAELTRQLDAALDRGLNADEPTWAIDFSIPNWQMVKTLEFPRHRILEYLGALKSSNMSGRLVLSHYYFGCMIYAFPQFEPMLKANGIQVHYGIFSGALDYVGVKPTPDCSITAPIAQFSALMAIVSIGKKLTSQSAQGFQDKRLKAFLAQANYPDSKDEGYKVSIEVATQLGALFSGLDSLKSAVIREIVMSTQFPHGYQSVIVINAKMILSYTEMHIFKICVDMMDMLFNSTLSQIPDIVHEATGGFRNAVRAYQAYEAANPGYGPFIRLLKGNEHELLQYSNYPAIAFAGFTLLKYISLPDDSISNLRCAEPRKTGLAYTIRRHLVNDISMSGSVVTAEKFEDYRTKVKDAFNIDVRTYDEMIVACKNDDALTEQEKNFLHTGHAPGTAAHRDGIVKPLASAAAPQDALLASLIELLAQSKK